MAVKAYPVQKLGMSARSLRQAMENNGVGVVEPGELLVTAGAGMASSVAVGRIRMRPNVAGVYKGIYEVFNDAALGLTHGAAGANPRIDQIVARVSDSTDLGSGSDIGEIAIVAGTATGGATLDNRTGAAALAANEILIADILVPVGAVSSASFTYRDRRPYASQGMVPRAVSGGTFDAVMFEPFPGTAVPGLIAVGAVNYQGASLMNLERPITATRIRFEYLQGATAATGNYIIAIFDASGRLIVSSSSTAFAGAANSRQAVSLTIASTRFEAGLYYVFIGTTIATASSNVYFRGAQPNGGASIGGPGLAGIGRYATTGGVTVPTTILGMTESSAASPAQLINVPIVALANG